MTGGKRRNQKPYPCQSSVVDARLSQFNLELRVDRESVCVCVWRMKPGPNGPDLGLCVSVCVCDRSGWKSRLSAPINEVLVWEMSDFYGLESGTV